MKKITRDNGSKVDEFYTCDEPKIENGTLFFKNLNGFQVALALSNKITIEPHTPKRDWLIVTGVASEQIYALCKEHFDEELQIMVQDMLTQQEAEELADKINRLMDSYKF